MTEDWCMKMAKHEGEDWDKQFVNAQEKHIKELEELVRLQNLYINNLESQSTAQRKLRERWEYAVVFFGAAWFTAMLWIVAR